MNNEITYHAGDLEDIASMFDSFAKNVKQSPLQNTKHTKELCNREAYVWSEAARILRATKLED